MLSLNRVCGAAATVGLAFLVSGSPAAAQTAVAGYTDFHRIGGTTSLNKTPLTNAASVKRMAETRGMAADISTLLAESGIPQTSDAIVAMLSAPASVVGGSCSDATPNDGMLVECDFEPGTTVEWMAYRPNIHKGNPTPVRMERLRWAGKTSFKAFLFRVTNNNRIYTFILPKPCGNLSLMSVSEQRVAVVLAPAPPPPLPPPPPAPVAPPPPAPPAPPAPIVIPPQAPAPVAVKASPFFIDLLGGKDRRVRPIAGRFTNDGSKVVGDAGASNADFAQCSPVLGLKIGVAKRFDNDWEVAGAVGVALSLVNDDKKVREHEMLVDLEANKYLSGGAFVGTGVSFWDITRSDTFTPALLLHAGVPMGSHPVYFVIEGRVFLRNVDNIQNNYQFWGGIRVKL